MRLSMVWRSLPPRRTSCIKSTGMNTALIYFTGTGNSLAVAILLAPQLSGATIHSVKEMLDRSSFALDVEACGLIFPVYCQDAPEILIRMVRRLHLPTEAYIFAIATHNGDVGYSHFTIDRILRKKGVGLKAGFAVLMPGNCITPNDSTNSEAEAMERLRESTSVIRYIADSVARKETVPYAGSASLRKRLKGFRNMFRYKVLHKVPEKFWVTDSCDRCGICARICPEHNITVDSHPPVWGRRCQMCLACIHWCPTGAVQNGKNTICRKRYKHPDISLADMLPCG